MTNEYWELQGRLRDFVRTRDWSQFHNPKNLAMALTGEVGELVEHLQWLSGEASDALEADAWQEVRGEIVDVQIYLMLLAERLDIDLMEAAGEKINENETKYPVERARGRSNKYTDL